MRQVHQEQRVGLVTYAALPQGAEDDAPLRVALSARRITSQPLVWDDPAVEWESYPLCIVRSTWDYHHRRAAFLAWVDRVAALTALWNPAPLLRWNTHKGYLRDLAARGVPVVPTRWLPAGSTADLALLLESEGWAAAVVKPAVGASAYGTRVVPPGDRWAGQAHLAQFLARHDMMVQPFYPSVLHYGERSLVYVDGVLTHAVRRDPPAADGTSYPTAEPPRVTPTADEQALGAAVLAALPAASLYARVDLVRDPAGTPRLLELELVEPSLFLRVGPEAADRLAAGIAAQLAGRGE
ncbi:MAG TPA: hypothetical protein VM536_00500 [Chloroflexia bacterium]|nr:hypothetical protein [Chloroflexia bacterium]